MKQEKMGHCDVGNHDVPASQIGYCAVCRTGVCLEHQGQPKALTSRLVACPRHITQVAEINRANLELLRDRLKRPEGEW